MATYRLEAKIIGRSSGRSATASAAYRAAGRVDDERTGQSFDYSRKRGVLHSEIIAPDNTPEWMRDRSQLWNAVEAAEKRKDAQLARDLVLSLPHELTHDQRVELARDFVRSEFVDKGMVADVSLHAPDRQGDGRNHHAHVMLTMRELTGDGFGKKVREWNGTDQLEQWREHWAQTVNQHLERAGLDARVDHRSLADQGIDREPEPKQGPIATEMERAGRPSHAGDDRRAAQERNNERAALATELSEITGKIVNLEEERAKRAEPGNEAPAAGRDIIPAAEPPPAQPNFILVYDAPTIDREPPGPPEPPHAPSPPLTVDRSAEPSPTTPTTDISPALSGGGSVLMDVFDIFTETLYECLYIARETGHELNYIAGELTRASSPEKLTDFAAREAIKREGEPPPREISPAEFATDANARRAHYAQVAAEAERAAAINQLRDDMAAGRHLNADAVRHLSRADLIEIRDKGDDALRQLIADREREEKRQRDYGGREREL
jgi:hypothetical protein